MYQALVEPQPAYSAFSIFAGSMPTAVGAHTSGQSHSVGVAPGLEVPLWGPSIAAQMQGASCTVWVLGVKVLRCCELRAKIEDFGIQGFGI